MANDRPRNILIKRAAGFIASHVANRLMRYYPEHKIIVLEKLGYSSNLKNLHPSHSSPNFKFIKGDICAQTHVHNYLGNTFEFTKNNVYGTHVLLEACKVTCQIKRFIHVTTDEEYGETDEDVVMLIKFVQDRPFHDQRYFIDYEKLKELGWSQQTSWEDGLRKTLDWYVKNPNWWGDVSGTLIARPRNCEVTCI
ncbi:hypothetical protein ACFX15_045282 [Malus domestica]